MNQFFHSLEVNEFQTQKEGGPILEFYKSGDVPSPLEFTSRRPHVVSQQQVRKSGK